MKWHADPDVGFVELWMNGGRKIQRTHMATAPPGVDHYVRQGIYRASCTCRTVVYGDAHDGQASCPLRANRSSRLRRAGSRGSGAGTRP